MGKGAQGSVFLVESRADKAQYVLKKVSLYSFTLNLLLLQSTVTHELPALFFLVPCKVRSRSVCFLLVLNCRPAHIFFFVLFVWRIRRKF